MIYLRNCIIFLCFLAGMMHFSCVKEENRTKELLQQHDWEQQMVTPWDSAYLMHKFFYTLRFNADETYFMETNWSFYDTLMYTESGIYKYDAGNDRITFPYAIDTVELDNLFIRVYLSPWQILQLDDTLMVARSEPGYQPPNDPGGSVRYEDDTLYFRPKE